MRANKPDQNNIPSEIIDWLYKRGISQRVIDESNIYFKDNNIVIPVYDISGNFLFNKYRIDPRINLSLTKLPKYKYDKGAKSCIYNIQKEMQPLVFITEGELDALRLESEGLSAVSSTGGSGTFLPEWGRFFKDKQVYIIYDNDTSGIKGAAKVQSIIPHARIIMLPKFDGKDVTDYLQEHTIKDFFSLHTDNFNIPVELDSVPQDRKVLKRKVDEYRDAANEIKERKREYNSNRLDTLYITWVNDYLNERYEQYSRMLKSHSRRINTNYGNNDVKKARSVSIKKYLQFSYNGFTKCIWHTEGAGSMYYNNFDSQYPNTVKCFGCGAMGDVIDVVMTLYDKDFKDAVKFINHGN